eukprot:COSAG06_NODE_64039_length_260_cov_1.285714_1_plen_41_part_10
MVIGKSSCFSRKNEKLNNGVSHLSAPAALAAPSAPPSELTI